MVDTNIFIYAYDPKDPIKQNRAIELLQDLSERNELTVSVQTLNEFYSRMTRQNRESHFTQE